MYYRIKDIPISDRPREKLIKQGVDKLTDIELLSIILKTGLKNKNVYDLAMDVLKNYSFSELKNVSINDLRTINGIGIVKAIEVIAAIEFGKRIVLKKEELIKLDSPYLIWEDAKYLFFNQKQECFYCYYFSNNNELISKKLIFMGTVNSSITHTREVFKEAYRVSASSIVCLHNHPSGDITPSKADIIFTNHLIETGKIQGIPVVDHIIVGRDSFYSFYENNKNID